MELCSICPSLTTLFHSYQDPWASFTVLRMTRYPSFLNAERLPVYVYTPFSFFIYLPVDTGQFSWILCTRWQWICDCRYLLDILILSSLDINSKEWFLDLMISLLILFWGTSKLFHNGYVISHSYQQVQKFQFATLLPKSFLFFLEYTTWKVMSLFDLVSISLILSDVEDYSYVYWSLLCLLWKNVYWSLYPFLKVSCLPFVVLKLSCRSCYIFWILAPYSDAKFADTSFHSISSLSVDCWRDHLFLIWSS